MVKQGDGGLMGALRGMNGEVPGINCVQEFKIHGGCHSRRLANHRRSHELIKIGRLHLGESKNGVWSGRSPRGHRRNDDLMNDLIWYDRLRGVKNKGRFVKIGGFEGHGRNGDLMRCVCLRGYKNWGRSKKSERVWGHLRNNDAVLIGLGGLGTWGRLLGCDNLEGPRYL